MRSHGVAAIVMERVEGSSLAAMRNTPLAMDKVLATSSQIARALAAALEYGIAHGDIKPDNILERPDGLVKVLDLGLAHKMTEGMSGEA